MSLGTSGLGAAGLAEAGIGLGGAGLEAGAGAAPPVPIIDAVQACDYFESDFQNNPEDLSGGTRVDVYWKEDGTRNWMNRTDRTDQYDVDPPWSILGADWGNRSSVSGGAVTYQLGGIQFTPDGTRMMTLSASVAQHVDMGTAFDIQTAGAVVNKFITPSMNKFHWTDDGLTMYVYLAGATKHIVQYPATEAFNVSTLNNIAQPFFDYSSDVASLNSMTISADGRFIYGSRGSTADELVSWEMTTPFDITSATNFCVGPVVNVLSNMTDPRLIFYRRDNGDVHLYSHLKSGAADQRVKVFSPSPGPDISAFSFDSEADLSGGVRDALNGVFVTDDGLHLYCCRSSIAVNDVFWFEMSSAHDLSTISITNESNAEGQPPRGIFVRQDGSNLFVLWRNPTNPDGLFRWTVMSTAFDPTTKSSRTPGGGFIVQPPGNNSPSGLHFKPDGLKFYITDASNTEVLEFTLDSAFDLASGTHTGTFTTSGEVTVINDITMDSTGTKMYVLDNFNDEVEQYSLTVPFDIDTAVASGVTPLALAQGTGTNPLGIHMTDDDTKLYVIYRDNEIVELYTI